MKKIIFSIALITLIGGCTPNQPTQNDKFAVYLEETDQIVFSEDDIESYEPVTHTFTFTLEGAEKMQSYQTRSQIDSGLYQKEFIAKLGNDELYRGKFWTMLSSLIVPDIVMTDIVMIGPEYKTLSVSGGYPTADFATDDNESKINDARLIEHFRNINKLNE